MHGHKTLDSLSEDVLNRIGCQFEWFGSLEREQELEELRMTKKGYEDDVRLTEARLRADGTRQRRVDELSKGRSRSFRCSKG